MNPRPTAVVPSVPLLPLVLVLLLVATGLLAGGPTSPATASVSAASTYSAPLRTAVTDLTVAGEVRTGYNRDLFRHWIDADGDGCDTRREVLKAEATSAPSQGSGCTLTGGRWYSYYDGATTTTASDFDIDHMVPLAEAWDSGARSWTSAVRERFANDLGDGRALVAVSASSNRAKSDGDIADWLPSRDRCRYLVDYVAVKHRWRLSVDTRERDAMVSLAGSCSNVTVSVTHAR